MDNPSIIKPATRVRTVKATAEKFGRAVKALRGGLPVTLYMRGVEPPVVLIPLSHPAAGFATPVETEWSVSEFKAMGRALLDEINAGRGCLLTYTKSHRPLAFCVSKARAVEAFAAEAAEPPSTLPLPADVAPRDPTPTNPIPRKRVARGGVRPRPGRPILIPAPARRAFRFPRLPARARLPLCVGLWLVLVTLVKVLS